MKKNISINISGIIFHIEEDGYERLEKYLNAIKTYFSSFEDSEEIILDIENRIAEIFLAKLNEGKQVITADDVDSLINTMGNVSDFQAVEDDQAGPDPKEEETHHQPKDEGAPRDNKLYRDRKRQIIGGVASGIAHYLRIDPLWIRLMMLTCMIDLVVTRALAPIVFVAYLVMWALLPGRTDLKEDKKVKKIYRNPDETVLGGVASGIAAYFGTTPALIRILFLLALIPGGAGLFIYIILWIIVPAAKTVTEKLEMKGEPVTLENIEGSIKRGLNVEPGEESTIVKVLLFPFRLIAEIIRVLGKVAGPFLRFLVEALRVAGGVFLVILSLSGLYSLAVAVGVWMGSRSNWMVPYWWDPKFEWMDETVWNMIHEILDPWLMIPLYLQALIPIIFIMLLGISILAKRWVARPLVNWSLFGLWIASLITSAIMIPRVVSMFSAEDKEVVVTEISENEGILILKSDGTFEDEFTRVRMDILPTETDQARIERIVKSRGRNLEDVQENIDMVLYDFTRLDSILIFPNNFEFADSAKFRGQNVRLKLYIPKGQPFFLDPSIMDILNWHHQFYKLKNHQVEFNEFGKLQCLDCPEPPPATEQKAREIEERLNVEGATSDFTLEPFQEVTFRGNLTILLKQSDSFRMQVIDNQEDAFPQIRQLDGMLYVEEKASRNGRPIEVILYAQSMEAIYLEEKCNLQFANWKGQVLEINASDRAVAEGAMEVQELEIHVEDDARIRLEGSTNLLSIRARDEGRLRAYDLKAAVAEVDAAEEADVRLWVTRDLTVNNSGSTNVRYKGTPETVDLHGKVLQVESN